MTESSQLTKLLSRIKKLDQLINKVVRERKDIVRDMRSLKAKGLIYARPHWRDKRYLYLLHPVVAGQPRRREYIGTNPIRIEAVKKGIDRAHQYDGLTNRLRNLDAAVMRAAQAAEVAIQQLRKW